MVGGLKILTVTSGREREFEALFAELRSDMHKHEPGCLLYSLLKSRKSSSDYIVHVGNKRGRESFLDKIGEKKKVSGTIV
jgi:heme-degrading monooxygenase HmoA